jgi:hypothetical protein
MGQLAAPLQAEESSVEAAATITTQAPTPLFGGALAAIIPRRLADVSLARPVPDHQEVFSDPSAGQALVLEILEHSGDIPDGEGAAKFYFDDLVEQNEASEGARLVKVEALTPSPSPSLSSSSPPPLLRGLAASPPPPSSSASSALEACSYAALATGTASISKGRSSSSSSSSSSSAAAAEEHHQVSLALALLRLPAVGSDLLVSLTSATALGGDGGGSSSSSSLVVPVDLRGRDPAEIAAEAERLLLSVVASLSIGDWALFG